MKDADECVLAGGREQGGGDFSLLFSHRICYRQRKQRQANFCPLVVHRIYIALPGGHFKRAVFQHEYLCAIALWLAQRKIAVIVQFCIVQPGSFSFFAGFLQGRKPFELRKNFPGLQEHCKS